ncbi:MAG TPA: alanine racemase [Candidatus Limnocylindrales bacterium]|nr:alanine racemase [Candidatus Limnocylindrales bacterium]
MTEAWLDGDTRARLDTPTVLVDLDRVDANVARMATAMRERGVALRPHAKTHKSLAVARRQLAAGAVGLTVATIGEAEVFADGGVEDLFIAYPVMALGPKGDRLRRLAGRCRLAVGADSIEGVEALAEAFNGRASPHVLIEIDSGGARSGVDPSAAGMLARAALDRGLEVVGVFTHAGQGYADPARRVPAAEEEVAGLDAADASLRREGIEPAVISAGSTPTALLSARDPVTEERPGSYVFGDRQQSALAGDPDDAAGSVALVVAATVVSHGTRGGFLVDAGAKVLGKDVAPYLVGHGAVLGYPQAVITRVNDHHGIAELPAGVARPAVGEVVLIVPNHVCPVVNLVDELVVVRDGQVVDRWPVDARGRNS